MTRLRAALVGCGGVVRRYRKACARLPGVTEVAAVDQDLNEAQAAARETGAAHFSSRFEGAFAPGVDVVVISTPNRLHKDHAVAALGAGKHVLLQKPMARSVEECDAILEAQRGSGTTLGVYMNLLDHPLFRDMRRMLGEGYLGRVALYSARLARPRGRPGGISRPGIDKNWRASRVAAGGGSFVQLGVLGVQAFSGTWPARNWRETASRSASMNSKAARSATGRGQPGVAGKE